VVERNNEVKAVYGARRPVLVPQGYRSRAGQPLQFVSYTNDDLDARAYASSGAPIMRSFDMTACILHHDKELSAIDASVLDSPQVVARVVLSEMCLTILSGRGRRDYQRLDDRLQKSG